LESKRTKTDGPQVVEVDPEAANAVLGGRFSGGDRIAAGDDPYPPGFQPGNSRPAVGRIASTIHPTAATWFATDLIVAGELTFVIGEPGAGKSTFGAHLCRLAQRPMILPGYEESVESALIPRLRAGQVRLETTLILDGRQWSLPQDRATLGQVVVDHQADLLWIDPIDTYVSMGSENDGPEVRAALESLVRIAHDTGVTVVAARHPGKQPSNLLPGSRQWRAVPRGLVRLQVDAGPPLRRYISRVKPLTGDQPPAMEYTLLGDPGEPCRFSLGSPVSQGTLDLVGESDQVERRKIDDAEHLLRGLLADAEQESSYIYAAAERERLGDRVVRRAAARIQVIVRREGVGREHRTIWRLPTPATPDRVTQTPPPGQTPSLGGVSVTVSGVEPPSPVKRKRKGVSHES
jgi:energy-coupling factor transporter ATP-binding protein EcfA2